MHYLFGMEHKATTQENEMELVEQQVEVDDQLAALVTAGTSVDGGRLLERFSRQHQAHEPLSTTSERRLRGQHE